MKKYFDNNIKPSVEKLEKLQNVKHIPIQAWEELDIAFGAPLWIDFIDSRGGAELRWSEGIPYKVTTVNRGTN